MHSTALDCTVLYSTKDSSWTMSDGYISYKLEECLIFWTYSSGKNYGSWKYCMAAIRKPQKALYVTMWGTVSRFYCYVCIQYVHMYRKQPMCCVQEALRKLAQNHQILTNKIVLGMRNIPYLEWGGNRYNTLSKKLWGLLNKILLHRILYRVNNCEEYLK